MADRQLFAKLGVVALLGLNVGAYYLVWPRNNGMPLDRAEATQAAPAVPIPAPPRNFPVALTHVAPLGVSDAPLTIEKAPDGDAVSRLLAQIEKEKAYPIPDVEDHYVAPLNVIPGALPIKAAPDVKHVEPAPAAPAPSPGFLPLLDAVPIPDAADPTVAITSALTRKSQKSAWLVNVTKSGGQTRLSAKLCHASPAQLPAEFEILCDRVDMNGADGQQALGNVTFVGAGIKGACQRLTMKWNSPSLVFEGQVRVTPENIRGWSLPTSLLRGERILWEQPTNDVDLNAAEFRPAGVLPPHEPAPGALGSPK